MQLETLDCIPWAFGTEIGWRLHQIFIASSCSNWRDLFINLLRMFFQPTLSNANSVVY